MATGRREVLAGAMCLALLPGEAIAVSGGEGMYGLIGRMKALPGQRDALLDILLQGTAEMPGCLSYVIGKDPADPDAIWITEVWSDRESHAASIQLPAVREAIAQARPLIAGFDNRHETEPVGGLGIASR